MTTLYKKTDNKTNYRPIRVPPSLSKIHENLLYKQLNSFFETKLSSHLRGFRAKYTAQQTLSDLLFNWQNCLDQSGVVSTILMDLSKAFHCLLHDLKIASHMLMDGIDYDILDFFYKQLVYKQLYSIL